KPDIPERKYAPDRKVDIIHVTIDLTPDFKARTITGTTTIKFVPIAKPLIELRLDAIDLAVSSVTSSASIAGYSVTDEAITVTFAPALEPDADTTVTIDYEAEPKRGLYFRTPEMGYLAEDVHLFTQMEPQKGRHCYPNYDYPNERFTSEVICRVPKDMTVLSNGRLISEKTDPETGLKAVRWLQDKPHVNYLIALAAGKFAKIESKYKDIPLAFYTPPSQIGQAHNSFKDTADMMGFFEREIGVPYPWNKYYQVVVDDFVSGGMENTTLTILNDYTLFTDASENIRSSQTLVSHELVHQWFGDYVTCKDWSHTWLNEGFATYYALLYDEHKDGRDQMLYGLYRYARGIVSDERTSETPIMHRTYDHPWEQFSWNRAYAKGAWIVHMLRLQLGEELYRKCIKTYLQRHALGTVVTEDLNSVIEELTGRSFDRFFDQWIFHAGHPVLEVSYSWSQKDKLAKVSVQQKQELGDRVLLFHFPTKVRFIVDDKTIDRDIFIDSDQHDFYFPLEAEPNVVRFDPEYSLLADIDFEKPKEMLYAQLRNRSDVIGRLLAIAALKEEDDKKTVANLKETLNNDPFYGVRKQASSALRDIHTDEAFEALADSMRQGDARARQQVVEDIGRFYRPESLELIRQILKTEKNPEILHEAICNLGRYNDEQVRQVLLDYLESQSYRERLAMGVVEAIDKLKDPYFITPLQETLSKREHEFRSWEFSRALVTLAKIASDEEDKTNVCNFLAGYVNHKKERIAAGAIQALGELGDAMAIGVVETFSGDDEGDHIQRTAKKALKKLREEKELVPDEISELREVVDELRKESQKLKDELEDLKRRLEAEQERKEAADSNVTAADQD
ncbi:MAG: M1 family aminopeptidase, partial [Planctomycetota bacterium]